MRPGFLQTILGLHLSVRQSRLARRRPPMHEDDFVQQIQAKGGDRDAACLIYGFLLDWRFIPAFTPYPEDALGKIYGIAEEERDEDLILDIFHSLEIEPPAAEVLTLFGEVDTPLRIAQLVQYARWHG